MLRPFSLIAFSKRRSNSLTPFSERIKSTLNRMFPNCLIVDQSQVAGWLWRLGMAFLVTVLIASVIYDFADDDRRRYVLAAVPALPAVIASRSRRRKVRPAANE